MSTQASKQVSIRTVVLGLALLAVAASPHAAMTSAPATKAGLDSTGHHHLVSVKDSPGYTPPVDPEANSEMIGRRLSATRVNKPFIGGAHSLDDFGRIATRLIQNQPRDSLEKLCVRFDEFRDVLWPEFPQSRPATGAHWQDAWFFQVTRNRKGCGLAMTDWGGHDYQYVGITCDSTLQYRNFKLYSKLTIAVLPAGADTVRWDFVKAIVARRGRFKILSMRD